MSLITIRSMLAQKSKDYRAEYDHSTYSSKYPYKIGIIKERWNNHIDFINACRELKILYEVVDISGFDWLECLENSECDAYLIRPSAVVSVWKEMYDEKVNIMVNELKKIIYPTYKEIWIFENKRRMSYWLKANGFPHPETYIFYDKKSALDFAENTKLPIVFKSTMGSGGRGVRVITKRYKLKRFIKRFFKHGFLPDLHEKKDKEWGSMIFQEYLAGTREWRIIRIGECYFGYEKLSKNGFHSGSGKWRYSRPPKELLDMAKNLTESGGFTSMDMDIFITEDDKILVNELQTFFGTKYKKEMCVVDNKPGRMVCNDSTKSWEFEPGSFCNNNLCNLRVLTLLEMLIRSDRDMNKNLSL